jgi:copper chaperone
MSCGHCVAAVKSALAAVPGVAVQNVTIGSATVALDSATNADTALKAVREAGYEARLATTTPSTSPRAG